MKHHILVINTGGTSTKIGIFESTVPKFVETIPHSEEELSKFHSINQQKEFREKVILDFLERNQVNINGLTAIAARGGVLRPLEGGTYRVNQKMISELEEEIRKVHASNLSAQIGYSIANKVRVSCYIVDPISVDEYEPIARISGHPLFKRESLTHALNMKAVAKRYAVENRVSYSEITVITAHLGTGISLAIHKDGKMVDGINPTEEGTFSGDRCGGLPLMQTVRYVLENQVNFKSFAKMVFGNGGLFAFFGTKDFKEISKRYHDGEQEVVDIVNAMAYQVAKDIGALATVNNGILDAIIITGGMAYVDYFVQLIRKRIQFIAPIVLYPGEDEMGALAEGVCRVLDDQEEAKTY